LLLININRAKILSKTNKGTSNFKALDSVLEQIQFRLTTQNSNKQYYAHELILELEKQLKTYRTYFPILITTGGILFILGTFLWYVKVQRIQDQLLLIQLKEAKAKGDKIKIETGRKHYESKVVIHKRP
jgi:hypothetical protein